MCKTVSSIGSSRGVQQPEPQEIELETLANLSGAELQEKMQGTFLRQTAREEKTGTAYMTESEDGLFLDLQLADPNEELRLGVIRLDDVQTVSEGHGTVLDGTTNYLMTGPFSGCSFFLLRIGDTDQAFHVPEAQTSKPLMERLVPYHMVADAIVQASGDTDLAALVDAYLERNPESKVTELKATDREAYVRNGLALMVKDNLQALSDHAFTFQGYTHGRGYTPDQSDPFWGSAMLVRESGRWNMLEQSAQIGVNEETGKQKISNIQVDRTALNPPDTLLRLRELAGLVAPAPLGDLL
ncbi:MAG: hypothetical protein H0S85_04905 [Desulfovibrionaceae bacterium]|jgi:hypothetical protein|nr:hypothetical protein [Desulfovibrionaceae bacterium]